MNAPRADVHGARSWLFVPGDRPDRFDTALSSGADVVVLDLEDAVAPARKQAARKEVVDRVTANPHRIAVRVNANGTPWHDEDLAALTRAWRQQPGLVVLPKSQDPDVVRATLAGLPEDSCGVALVETAAGVMAATELACTPGVARLAIGTYDLAAQLRVDPTHRPAMAAARGALVLASAIGGLSGPIDGVSGAIDDEELLSSDIEYAAALGFEGKLCIHPRQVSAVATGLGATPAQQAWARRILAAAEDHDTDVGVLVVDGEMVDAPVIDRARRIVHESTPANGESA